MNRRIALIGLLAVLIVPATAGAMPTGAAAGSAWSRVSGGGLAPTQNGAARTVRPRRSSAYVVDAARLKAALADAPSQRHARRSDTVVSVPAPDGTLERFRVAEAPVMAAGAARDASGFHGFSGIGLDDPTATLRLDYSVLGFHASVRSERGLWFVDPAYRTRSDRYVSYYGRALPKLGAARSERAAPRRAGGGAGGRRALPTPGAVVTKRTYRLALTSDPSYAESVADPEADDFDDQVTAAKETLISRVNQVYNEDLGVTLVLVADNNLLNFNDAASFEGSFNATDCYSGDSEVLLENQTVTDDLIGNADYDIGHIAFGPDGDGGGIAGLGVVGNSDEKAQGCTGFDPPEGDFFAIDYVAHEFGHQFGSDHTFNGTLGSCGGGTRSAENSVEPGSGSSIMAYAGICLDDSNSDNLQAHSDPYFSQRSIELIQTYVGSSAAAGGAQTASGNRSPVVTAPPARTIPVRTPFTLSGSATDADGDALTYTWEQNDTSVVPDDPDTGDSPTRLTSNVNKTSGPLFRQFSTASTETTNGSPATGENTAKGADAVRTFPDVAQILAGATNAATGACPAVSGAAAGLVLDCYSEFLPTAAWVGTGNRTLHFRLTARDRGPVATTAGGVSSADVAITTAGSAPFRVTSQATPAAATGNTSLPVTWDVAGTNGGAVNTPTVKISYSTDGGLTFPTVVLATTANDGSESVVVPNVATTSGRFKVEAVDNYFFDVSDGNLSVTPGTGTATVTASPTASGSATATASPTVTATATTTATVTPITTAAPTNLVPSLAGTAKTLKVARSRKTRVKVSCSVAGDVAAQSCPGSVTLSVKGKRVGRASFTVAPGAAKSVSVRISKKAFKRLRGGKRVKAKVTVTIGGRSATKSVKLKR